MTHDDENGHGQSGHQYQSRKGQFKGGAPSPNPRGRPKLNDDERFAKVAAEVLNATIVAKDLKGRQRRQSKLEIIIQALAAINMKPDAPARARKLLLKLREMQSTAQAPPVEADRACGVLMVEPYMSPEEWTSYWRNRHRSPDPLDGLPGIDREALAKALEAKQRMQERGYEDPEDE